MKINRNDPCWCGSDKKFKFCHLLKNDNKSNFYDVAKDLKKLVNKKFCLYPEANKSLCRGAIIKAHTIQRNGGLNKISRDGHVYGFITDLVTVNKNKGMLLPKLIGINEASTFTGFCNYHDTTLFEPIEKNEFTGNELHTFLLGYRAICKEYFLKLVQKSSIEYIKETSPPIPKNEIIETIQIFENGLNSGIKLIKNIKKQYDDCLLNNDFSKSNYCIIRINELPPILTNGASYPDFDFNGNRLQNIGDLYKKLDFLTFSIIATESGGAIIFQWIDENAKSKALIRSLLNKDISDIPNLIVKYALSNFENTYMSPSWWEGIPENKKENLIIRINHGVHPFLMRRNDTLVNDNIDIINFEINNIETNINFN